MSDRRFEKNYDRHSGQRSARDYDREYDRYSERNYDRDLDRRSEKQIHRQNDDYSSRRPEKSSMRRVRDMSIQDREEKTDRAEKTDISSTRKERIVQTIVDFIIVAIVLVIFGIVYVGVDPKIRHFYCDETDIFYPYKPDTIPFWAVGIYGALGPILIILFVESFNILYNDFENSARRSRCKSFLIHFFHGLSLFLMGAVITMLLTEIGKRWIGRLRPHFMSVCKPDYSTFNCTTAGLTGEFYNPIYTGDSFCTGDADEIKEARFSFPSGHSSFAWYTMLYTIIYLEARFRLLCFRYVKTLIQMTCFITAFVTMLSRVSDYHHRGSDVIAGTVLGCLIAVFITLCTGQVLFKYNGPKFHSEIDFRKNSMTRKDQVDYR